MKKRIYISIVIAAVCVIGTAGCSAGQFGLPSAEGGIIKTVMEKLFDHEGKSDDLTEAEQGGEGRNGEENTDSGENEKEVSTANENAAAEMGIINNGETVVRFQGNDYYWKYTVDSVEHEGLFAYYSFSYDVPNQMVCRRNDGTEEVLFTMEGSGSICLAGERMYLTAGGEAYSVKMDGSDRIDYGYCRWEAVDQEGKGIVGYADQKLFYLDGATGERTELAGSSEVLINYRFAAVLDNCLYYSSYDGNSHELAIYQYNLNGLSGVQEMTRVSLTGELYDIAGEVIVTQMQRQGNILYYSFGFYAGTGGFFQTGGIYYIVLDENGNGVGLGTLVQKITAGEFLVEEKDGAVNVYYIDEENGSYIGFWQDSPYSGCSVMNSVTGAVQHSDFRLSRPGAAVYLDGAVCRADEHQASFTVLIPEPMATAYGCRDEDLSMASSATLIKDVEVIGNEVYYTVEKSSRNPQGDMGWRPGFVRNSSERYKMTIGQNNAQLLFAY